MSRILVTGATGFLGHHLVPLLLARGDEVVALCRGDEPALAAQGVIVKRGDILDAGSVIDAAAGCATVLHCAGKVSRKPEDAEELHRVHVEGTKRTLDACRAAGVTRAVIASTSGVVAVTKGADEIRNEKAPAPMDLLAGWPYYRSKLFAERAAFDRNVEGFEVVAVNPTLLLGPGDERGSSTGDVVQFLEGKVPFIPAGGLSFVDARDAAAGIVLAMDKGRAGERYLLSAVNLTIEAFFGRLARISGVAGPRMKAPRSVMLARAGVGVFDQLRKRLSIDVPLDRISAEMSQHFWYVDASKAKDELGWTPRDAGETLAETVDDLRARGVIWPS